MMTENDAMRFVEMNEENFVVPLMSAMIMAGMLANPDNRGIRSKALVADACDLAHDILIQLELRSKA